jgi:hypothetical protein
MSDPGGFARRAAVAVCATVLASLLVTYGLLLAGGKVHIEQSDLLVYYSASHLVLLGHGGAIYTLGALKAVERSALHALLLPRTEAVFLYPPFVALALAPFAALGYAATYVLWLLVNCALLAAVLRALARYLDLGALDTAFLAAAGASFLPVVATLLQGQVSILLLAAVAGVFFALRSGRDMLGGALLGLVLLKPPYVLPFLVLLLVQRRWRALGAFVAAAGVLALIPIPVLGVSTDLQYLHLLREAAGWHTSSGGFSPQANENLWGFFRLLLPASVATMAQVAVSAAVLLGVAQIARRPGRSVDVTFAAATVAAVLVNPHVLIHDLALLLLPAAVVLRWTGKGKAVPVLLIAGYGAALAAAPIEAMTHVQVLVPVMAGAVLWLCTHGEEAEEDCALPTLEVTRAS